MIRDDEQCLSVADRFYAAAMDSSLWYGALEALASATGSRTGELITIGSNAAVPINVMTDVSADLIEAFVRCGGGDPNINPRVNAGIHAPILQVLAESDFISPSEHKHHPHYREFAHAWDLPFICLTNLERCKDMVIGLAVLRSRREGHITRTQREVFASLAPHVRGAVRMQRALEGRGAALIAGAMELLGVPAFVCDRSGEVQALTPQAEALVTSGRGLQLKLRRLRAQRDSEDTVLDRAIRVARMGLRVGTPGVQSVIVRTTEHDKTPIVLDIMTVPSAGMEFGFAPRVLIVARGSRGTDGRKAAVLQGIYAFTSAETDIALQLARGKTVEDIAEDRHVVVGTVRAQIKTLLAKVGVSRQIELVARMNEF